MSNTGTVSTDSTDPESTNDSDRETTFVLAAGVPSLTTWGLVALGALLAAGALWARRKTAPLQIGT